VDDGFFWADAGLEEFGAALGDGGTAEEETLFFAATLTPQKIDLRARFHSLGDDALPETLDRRGEKQRRTKFQYRRGTEWDCFAQAKIRRRETA